MKSHDRLYDVITVRTVIRYIGRLTNRNNLLIEFLCSFQFAISTYLVEMEDLFIVRVRALNK